MNTDMGASEHRPQIVDLESALRRLGGNEELLRTLVRYFFEDAPELLASLRTGAANDDLQAARSASHKLCGLSSNFGAERAVAAARRVEELALAGDVNQLGAAAAELDREIISLTEALLQRP